MAHPEQATFVNSVKERLPEYFNEVSVLDVGSADINGNNRQHFSSPEYTGLDIGLAKNVDVISPVHLYKPERTFDVVISTGCFEHDFYWEYSLKRIVELLREGGLFVFTCATTGHPEHGTKRTTPHDSLTAHHTLIFERPEETLWPNYYKNLEENDIRAALDLESIFSEFGFDTNDHPKDLYFWGIKK